MAPKRKLIEVSLPLEAINRESAREKSIRHGHPSTLHLWWARRPLAAARAVLFAQLVDDPSSRPEEFPTEEAQAIERERLHDIIRRLVVWENVRDERLLDEARAEILKSTDGNPPPILDPFAGGGTIPLEAQRLGLEAHASDLNPVAVLINKALIEFPPKFRDWKPVFPGLAESQVTPWTGASGLAADVRAYGQWMRDEAEKRIGHLYPKATLPDGSRATVIAWLWARTITCPNPACGIEMPLLRTWWLGKAKGREAYVVPSIVPEPSHPSGKRVAFAIGHDAERGPSGADDGTMSGRRGAVCVSCSTAVSVEYVRSEHVAERGGQALLAVVAEGSRRRHYIPPTKEHLEAANVTRPENSVSGVIATNPRWFSPPVYGFTDFEDLFTDRQLVALTTLGDLVTEVRDRVIRDARTHHAEGARLDAGGSGAAAYADAVAVYLGLGVSRSTDYFSSINTWATSGEFVRNVFARQAIPMAWDFVETNPFSSSSGNFDGQIEWIERALERVPGRPDGEVSQQDASTRDYRGALVSTDPPYYDNIGYSDLSDYFYVWQRRILRGILPSLYGTVLVPKAEELVANPYRHQGKAGAKQFFESGFQDVFARVRDTAASDYPIAVYYAFKQTESDAVEGEASSGWQTLLQGMIQSGWAIVATWPVRSEREGRSISIGTNALASSVVLALRPRPLNAPITDRRGFISALRRELGEALRTLQFGGISPQDLPQAAIGPGMAVFSRYSQVVETDGSQMSVRAALARINEVLDEVQTEQEGDFDPTTRFAIAWYRVNGYRPGLFGAADDLARARNTAVATMERNGILKSRAGKVQLIQPDELSERYDVSTDDATSSWEALHHAIRHLETGGVASTGAFLRDASLRPDGAVDLDLVKELAYLLAKIAEQGRAVQDALRFSAVATAWPELMDAVRSGQSQSYSTSTLDFGDDA